MEWEWKLDLNGPQVQNGRFFRIRKSPLMFSKKQSTSSLAEAQSASQKELCSTEIVFKYFESDDLILPFHDTDNLL
jgi:hypothetical protein